MSGKFITFEGSEGSGKSTQIELAQQYLEVEGKDVLFLREPGGVIISEKIRAILLDTKTMSMGNECETLLYMAARAQLVEEVIIPALNNGRIILCDRFLDSTIAYQGYGNGINIEAIKKIGMFATQGYKPDLTFLFDLDVHEGLARINRPKDRIENRSIDYHNRVRKGYLEIAKLEPDLIKVIDAKKGKEKIQSIVKEHINCLLNSNGE